MGKMNQTQIWDFAKDLANEEYYSLLGGRGTYPYTVVLDENGIISQIFVKALEYDDLKNAVEAILNEEKGSVHLRS